MDQGRSVEGYRLGHDLDRVLAKTAGTWDEFRGARLFLTGATGFIGSWLLDSLLWANERLALGASVVALTRDGGAFSRKEPRLAKHPAVSLHIGDVRDFVFPAGEFSLVIHGAAGVRGLRSSTGALARLDTQIDGTRRVLECARLCQARKLLLISSGAVYGEQPPHIAAVPESHSGAPDPLDPISFYGEGKRAAEQYAAAFSGEFGLEVKVARCFSFVGPRLALDSGFAVGDFLRDAVAQRPIRVAGDGTPLRSFLYAADLAIWLWTILVHGRSCRAYNVGSDEVVSISELARMVADSVQPPVAVEIERRPEHDGRRQRYVPSIERASTELGLRPWVPLAEALRRTVQWHERETERSVSQEGANEGI